MFIRENPETLHHICSKEKIHFGKVEKYLVGQVRFDPIEGEYWCDQCKIRLGLADIWSDPEFTGCESHC